MTSDTGMADTARKAETMKAMTLRIEDSDAERLRKLAFDKRVPQSDIIRHALHTYLLQHGEDPAVSLRGMCDALDCNRRSVMTTTPGGFRFCDEHRPRAGGSGVE